MCNVEIQSKNRIASNGCGDSVSFAYRLRVGVTEMSKVRVAWLFKLALRTASRFAEAISHGRRIGVATSTRLASVSPHLQTSTSPSEILIAASGLSCIACSCCRLQNKRFFPILNLRCN